MRMLACLLLALATALGAEEFVISTQVGIGGTPRAQWLVEPPFTPLVVRVDRSGRGPVAGRVVVQVFTSPGRGVFEEQRQFELSQDIGIEESASGAAVTFEMPVFPGTSQGLVRFETASGGNFEPVAAESISVAASSPASDSRLVGFVSHSRLGVMEPWLLERLVEIEPGSLPISWKLLACFDAIVLNDDRLTRLQSEALVDYVAAGGSLVLSPNSAAAFNPELPLHKLLGATAGTTSTLPLRDFPQLQTMPEAPVGGEAARESGPPQSAQEGARLLLWPSAGRARPAETLRGLFSTAYCGAGRIVFMHADLSAYPFAPTDGSGRTVAGINALKAAIGLALPAGRALSRPPLSRLSTTDVRNVVDIAGKRIPNRDLQVLMIFLYVCAAGVGLFLLARRLKRPEVYPAVLLGLALLSVALVFSLGHVFKRAGDRARAVRLVVGDGGGGRNALFTLGCAYVHEGDRVDFSLDRSSWLIPANLLDGRSRGLPPQYVSFNAGISAVETAIGVRGLERWQNLFFVSAGPTAPADLRLEVRGDGAAHTVVNHSPGSALGCLVLIGRGQKAATEWHYLDVLGPAGSPEAAAPLSGATQAPSDMLRLADRIKQATEDDIAAEAMIAFLNLPRGDTVIARDASSVMNLLDGISLLPGEGEYLMLAMLEPAAVSSGSLGLRAIEPERIGQAVLWAARGMVEPR